MTLIRICGLELAEKRRGKVTHPQYLSTLVGDEIRWSEGWTTLSDPLVMVQDTEKHLVLALFFLYLQQTVIFLTICGTAEDLVSLSLTHTHTRVSAHAHTHTHTHTQIGRSCSVSTLSSDPIISRRGITDFRSVGSGSFLLNENRESEIKSEPLSVEWSRGILLPLCAAGILWFTGTPCWLKWCLQSFDKIPRTSSNICTVDRGYAVGYLDGDDEVHCEGISWEVYSDVATFSQLS